MMELQEFISQTLRQIIDGVRDAQTHALQHGARVNPQVSAARVHAAKGNEIWDEQSRTVGREVQFDVAISTSEGAASKGGAGLFVGPLALGARGESESTDTSSSRIKFSVPVVLPPAPQS